VPEKFTAETRSDFGKGAARRLRRDGRIPAVVYGANSELLHISLPAHELTLALRVPSTTFTIEVDGSTRLVKPRDVQRDPVRRDIEHVDFIVIDEAEARARAARSEEMVAEAEAAAEAAAKAFTPKGPAMDEPTESGEAAGEGGEGGEESGEGSSQD
jgi:ribosomal protein L25 (general stress protein Ctc)